MENVKIPRGRVVHAQKIPVGFAGERQDWPKWAVCGAAGSRRLKETKESINCKLCLRYIERSLRGREMDRIEKEKKREKCSCQRWPRCWLWKQSWYWWLKGARYSLDIDKN